MQFLHTVSITSITLTILLWIALICRRLNLKLSFTITLTLTLKLAFYLKCCNYRAKLLPWKRDRVNVPHKNPWRTQAQSRICAGETLWFNLPGLCDSALESSRNSLFQIHNTHSCLSLFIAAPHCDNAVLISHYSRYHIVTFPVLVACVFFCIRQKSHCCFSPLFPLSFSWFISVLFLSCRVTARGEFGGKTGEGSSY